MATPPGKKMFGFLKRWLAPAPAPVPQRKRAARRKSTSATSSLSGPAPLPEMVEGNQESDWALWEDSKTALDSQMQGLSRPSGYGRMGASQYDTLPSELGNPADSLYGDIDAFGSVRKRDR
jgi:hypothetical protein